MFLRNNEGISPVLGFILMLAIGITILTTVQLTFVPVWNTQEELNHIKLMQDDFRVLKSNIDSGILGGTTLSSPLTMGFKYSPKMLVYNPLDEAYASLEIRNSTWVELRYNELLPEGMTDDTSIKNIYTGKIIYALNGARNYNSFIYENGIIRRGGSNFTTSSQTVLANDTIFLPGVKALDYGITSAVEKKTINIYPTSQQKNSVIGNNVWITLHIDGEYVDWWKKTLENEGATVKIADNTSGIVIANVSKSLVIKMGEAYISSSPGISPPHAPAKRIVMVPGTATALPVGGTTEITVEVQDEYNNPVPNVPVNFYTNTSSAGHPGNSYASAVLSPASAISGADGRASVTLSTADAGYYYIDAALTDYKTTFVYSAASQGYVLGLVPSLYSPDSYNITATLKDSLGNNVMDGTIVVFDTGDGSIDPVAVPAVSGRANTTLNVSSASGIKITNIQVKDTYSYSANITWDTVNNITVIAKSGYVINSKNVPTKVNTNGCVFYGTSPGNYAMQACDIISSWSHSAAPGNLLPGTAYYFIINSSRPGGTSVNSTEYMFVTSGGVDVTPPASVTGLMNVTYAPMFIRWLWTDPADADFDHVEVMIDDVPQGTVGKGIQSFNASYLMPNSPHNISIRTVDSSGNANATWVKNNASTAPLFTFVFEFTNSSGLGIVSGDSNAMNDSDGGASALLNKTSSGGSAMTENYTYVSGNTANTGTVASFTNMQSAADGGIFATFTEGAAVTSRTNRTNNPGKVITTGTQSGSYTPSNLDNTDGAIDITNPAISGTTTAKAYLMNTSRSGVGGTLYWNINTTNGVASNTSTIITISGTANRNYTFRPGQNNNKVTGNPGTAPAGYGWVSTASVNGITGAGTWSFQVRTVSSINTRNGRILVYVYKYNATSGTNTFLFSASGTANHLGTTTGTTELITSSAQPEYVFNPDEYLKIEYWLNAITASNGATLRFETNTANPYVQYSKNMYSLNTTYTFTETNSSSSWQSISIQDGSYADALANASIFNITSGRWESILAGSFSGGTSPSVHVNAIIGASGNASSYNTGSGQIKLMYNWTNAIFNNSLGIDLINVTVAYTASTYSLNITTSTTNVSQDVNSNYYLEINYSRDAGETGYDVYVYNGTDWNLKGSLTSSSWSLANFTLGNSEIINGNVNVLYLDQNPAGGVQGNLYIDYQRVHNYTPAVPAGYHLDIIANTTGIPDASSHKLRLRYNATGDNFTLSVYNVTAWNIKGTLNNSAMTYVEVPLNTDELLPDGIFTPFTVNSLNRYYVLVRYVDESYSKQGKLYLDYQGVFSS
ncbi:Bacterial Ig-like domain (group 1) [uncultured archaeon]|nr:Bacterial Ig-like domain (group 1) [uncultured archaeon]